MTLSVPNPSGIERTPSRSPYANTRDGMPTPVMAGSQGGGGRNLQPPEIRPITKGAAVMAARTTRSLLRQSSPCARFARACVSRRTFARSPLRRGELDHPLRFVLRRHPAVRRELIDEVRQILAQSGQQVALIHPALS
jgi:hypothetical protein